MATQIKQPSQDGCPSQFLEIAAPAILLSHTTYGQHKLSDLPKMAATATLPSKNPTASSA